MKKSEVTRIQSLSAFRGDRQGPGYETLIPMLWRAAHGRTHHSDRVYFDRDQLHLQGHALVASMLDFAVEHEVESEPLDRIWHWLMMEHDLPSQSIRHDLAYLNADRAAEGFVSQLFEIDDLTMLIDEGPTIVVWIGEDDEDIGL